MSQSTLETILSEGPITCARAAKLPIIPHTRNGPPSGHTVARWALVGIVLPSGQRLKLEAARVNGKVVTSEARIRAFFAQQQLGHVEVAPRSPARRESASEAADRELAAAGA